MKLRKYIIKESSLSKLWRYNEEHDCGSITAFRFASNCGDGDVYTKKQNKARNTSLLSKLKTKGYVVISLKGKYPEGGVTKKEQSFFVVDIEDKKTLRKDLEILGEEFEQDSILYIPEGSIQNKTKAMLIKTNNCPNNWMTTKTVPFEKGKLGYSSKIFTSYVNGRPFIFEEIENEIVFSNGFMAMLFEKYSKMKWEDIVE